METRSKKLQESFDKGITAKSVDERTNIYDYQDYPYPGLTPSDVPNANFCWHRLPCGICRITNMPCPKAGNSQPTITWTTNTIGDAPKHLQPKITCDEVTK